MRRPIHIGGSEMKIGNPLLTGVATLFFVSVPAAASAQERSLNLPAGPATNSIPEFARQAGIQIVSPGRVLRKFHTPALRGAYDVRAALKMLIQGSGLRIVADDGTTVTLGAAQADDGTAHANAASSRGSQVDSPSDRDRSDIVVTGTRIRGAQTASPVITITGSQIREEGFDQLGDVIRSIPQNFSGGQNPGVASGAGNFNANITGGSAINLRGLGPDATLTLLNGHRLSYGGFSQAVDVSVIPVAAVQRIEIVTDGASAIYGSDAVGGVANVLLKRDYNGVTAAARYGLATAGGGKERELSLTGGTTWDSGGFIAAFDYRKADEFRADQRSYTAYLPGPYDFFPAQRHYSGIASLHQQLSNALEFSIDGLYTDRLTTSRTAQPDEQSVVVTSSKVFAASPSLKLTLPGDWTINLQGSRSSEIDRPAATTYDPGTVTATETRYRNISTSAEANVEGPLFELPGGAARLAAGAGYRRNEFSVSTNDPFNGILDTRGNQASRYAFGEILLPVISPAQNIPLLSRLSLTGALRYEKYDDIGGVTTPKLGLIYEPVPDLTLSASWGRSFKVPTLFQRFQSPIVALYPAFFFSNTLPFTATILYSAGANPTLQPERARTWSTTASIHPRAVPGLSLTATYFSIDYRDRVVTPVSNLSQALVNPIYAPYVALNPNASQVNAVAALAGASLLNATGAPLDPASVAAIIDGRLVNAARQRLHGIDVSGSYGFALGGGTATVRGSGSWLTGRQQLIVGQSFRQTVGDIYNPPKFHARGGVVWVGSGLTLSGFVNHLDGVINTDAAVPAKTGSFTTADFTVRYQVRPGSSFLSNVEFSLSIDNAFNARPPLYTPRADVLVNYDSTNYSAIGRYMIFGISKKF